MRARQRPDAPPTVRVLLSFKEPHAQTNPYITQLRDSLASTSDVEPVCFTWRNALTGKLDVFHAHWPESLIEQRDIISTFGRRVLYGIFLARLRLQRIPIVRTVHNIALPAGISRFDMLLLKATERLTVVRILLNQFTPTPPGSTTVLIEHGHYRDWFAKYHREEPIPGRITFFGKIRRYKNVEGLVRAFRSLQNTDATSLHVLGTPSSAGLAESLLQIADHDPRITLAFRYVDDAELVKEVSESQLVVLPYPEMHNSGSVLAALSLNRPVLVPDNDFNRALSDEVGPGWVICYRGDLDTADLELGTAPCVSRSDESPNLSHREWRDAGERHLAAYRQALAQVRNSKSFHG